MRKMGTQPRSRHISKAADDADWAEMEESLIDVELLHYVEKNKPLRVDLIQISEDLYRELPMFSRSQIEKVVMTRRHEISHVMFLGPSEPSILHSPPGSRLVSLLSFVLPKRVYEQVVQQQIADMREDYFEALASGRKSKAEWDAVLQRANIWLTLLLYLGASVVDRCMKLYGQISSK